MRMERRETKRVWGEGSEMINSKSEEESSAKQPKLSEIGMMKIDEDDGFEDLTPECSQRPESAVENVIEDPPLPVLDEGSEKMNLKKEEETSAKELNPGGYHEDFELVDPPISDDWKYVNWQKRASSLWVVTKSPYSCDWIKDVLKSEVFNEYKSDEKIETFQIHGDEKFSKSVSSRSCVMFCFESDRWDSESSKEVKDLSSHYGLKNVLILLSEKTPDSCPPGQMNGQHNFPVLNFSKQQIAWYKDYLKFYNMKIEKMKTILIGSASWTGHKVGIFSRSSESEYEWLKMNLESEYFQGSVENVQSYYISNRGFQQFMTNVSNSTFGILYHTKNRGRINITDVTDSLYDEELDYMSSVMNKNVIVVVDDLNNGNDEEKSRILSSQPSIKEKALDLFLFTTEEKKLLEPLMKLRNSINGEQQVHIDESCVLGKGSFGTVYKGSFNGTTAAIKKVIYEETMREQILLEVVLTMKLQHPNIVKYLAATERDGAILLVLEYIPGANLHDVLHKQECPIKLSEADKMSVCLDVLSAVEYAHFRNIIHQDIKPGNILIKEETKKALLTDWGAANIRITIDSTMERSERIGLPGGTYLYMAPERFLNRLSRSTKMSDMWSVGATFVQLFTNRLPWEYPEMIYEQMRMNKLPRTLNFLPKNVDPIIKGSMSYKPEERLTASAMLSAMKAVKIMSR